MAKFTLLLTGGSGFIGKNISEQLNPDYLIIAPNHGELDFVDTEEVDKFFSCNKVDYVVHTAFMGVQKSGNKDVEFIAKNIRMYSNLLKHAEQVKKIIMIGSGAEYDKSRPLCLVKEELFGERIPMDSYGFSKYIGSLSSKPYQNVITVRPFGVYGKYEMERRFISYVIKQVLIGEPITIKQNLFFDYLYIDDLVRIIRWIITHTMNYNTYNLSSDKRRDLLSIVQVIFKTVRKEVPVIIEKEGIGNEYTADANRLLKEIPSFSFTKLTDGIDRLFKYYSNIDEKFYA